MAHDERLESLRTVRRNCQVPAAGKVEVNLNAVVCTRPQ
jgi:hypothetical protein